MLTETTLMKTLFAVVCLCLFRFLWFCFLCKGLRNLMRFNELFVVLDM